MLEHVVASGISRRFTEQNILSGLQHGFQEKKFCARWWTYQKYEIILSSLILVRLGSRLWCLLWVCHFPMVSWVRCGTWLYRFLIFATLLFWQSCTRNYYQNFTYGMRGNILNWIKDLLDNRTQSVLLNGTSSDNMQCPQVFRRARFSDPYCFWPT